MTKDDVGPIAELGRTIEDFVDGEVKDQIMAGSEGIARAPGEEVSGWLKGAIDRLDALVDEETRVRIMEQMGFNCAEINRSHVEQSLAKRNKFETLAEFLEAEERQPSPGTRLVREGDVIYQYYQPLQVFGRRCFCSLWRGLGDDENASLTWCQCSKGFVMKLWEAYVGSPVKVELVESCIAGAEECKFAVHL
jgi:hypothetical protein